jgi:Protein of unknown function (DUF2795)
VFSAVATLQTLLEGIDLPARKRELIAYARREGDAAAVRLLERLPDREYASLDEVGEALAPVQPRSANPHAELPRDESGEPPGGDDYLNADPTPGGVRHDAPPENPPQKAIEEQTKTQSDQQEKQKQMLGEE